MAWLRRHFLSVDPRTLALTRVLLASLLLVDLCKRWLEVALWYDQRGLIPTTLAMTTGRPYKVSIFFAFERWQEVAVVFALVAVVYVFLLVGYRTRWAQVLSLVAVVSLHTRVDMLSNGGDFVLDILCWWTVFMPMGRRFSVDALLRSMALRREQSVPELEQTRDAPRNATPFVSLAVLAASLQLSVIYFFNTVQKNGVTWQEGSPIHYLLQQERLITPVGVWLREHAPYGVTRAMSFSTLVVEGALPLLILSPWGKPWTRRVAVLFVFGLHASIQLVGNFGVFSPTMAIFSTLLITSHDWDWLQKRGRGRTGRARQVFFDSDCGVCFLLMRVLVRMDLMGRLTPLSNQDTAALPQGVDRALLDRTLLVVDPASGRRWTGSPAWGQVVGALPLGGLLAWLFVIAPLRQLIELAYGAFAARRTRVSAWLGLAACGVGPAHAAPGVSLPGSAPGPRRLVCFLRELLVLFLLVAATAQVFHENWIIHRNLRVARMPPLLAATISYTRLQQGWSMFAPDAPRNEMSIVVDARTRDGRHFDPLNELASRNPDPARRTVPVQPGLNVFWVDYFFRVHGSRQFHAPLRHWLLHYHERSGRPEDRIVSFNAYLVRHDSPPPGEKGARKSSFQSFLRQAERSNKRRGK